MDRNTLPLVLISPKIGVALRKESVDRNVRDVSLDYKEVRRSPQGERG